MSLLVKAGSFTMPASTGNQSVTGVGFQPKAIIFVPTNNGSDGLEAGSAKTGIGMAVSSTQRCATILPYPAHGHANDCCIWMLTGGGSEQRRADLVSMDSDGFTVNWATVGGASGAVILYFAIGGTDVTNAAIKEFTSPTSTGTQGVTGVGFQPDAAVFLSVGLATAPRASVVDATTNPTYDSVGFATSSTNRAAVGRRNIPITSATDSVLTTGSVIHVPIGSGTFLDADLDSFDSDGFTLDWTDVESTARYCWALCLKGGSYKVAVETSPAGNGSDAATGVGFQPKGGFFSTVAKTAGAALGTVRTVSYGAANSSSSRWAFVCDPFSSSYGGRLDRAKALLCGPSNSSAGDADLTSFDTDGFTLNWANNSGAVAFEYLAFLLGDAEGQLVTAGLTSETDSAFAVTVAKRRAVGLNTETDSVLAATRAKRLAVGLNTETDSAFSLARFKVKIAGLNTEADSAFAVAKAKRYAAGLNTETDTALPVSGSQAILVGIAEAIDTALAVTKRIAKAVGLTTETDEALPVANATVVPVGQAQETDSAFSVAKLKRKLVGLAREFDSAKKVLSNATVAWGLKFPLIRPMVRNLIQSWRSRRFPWKEPF